MPSQLIDIDKHRGRLSRVCVLSASLLAALLAGCASYEPRTLTPSISLSPESVQLGSTQNQQRWDFGLEVGVNESDSLFNLETLPGVRVRRVQPGGPAAQASIEAGDVILDVNGVTTNSPDALLALQQEQGDGDFQLRVQRGTLVFATELQARQAGAANRPQELFRLDPIATRAGYRSVLRDAGGGQLTGAEVIELFPQSPLPQADIRPGDVIVALAGETVGSAQELVNRLNQDFAPGARVQLELLRGEQRLDSSLRLWDPGRRLSRVHLGPLFNYESSLNPPSTSVNFLDLWLFSVYRYQRMENERSHSLLGLFSVESGLGQLVEEEQ